GDDSIAAFAPSQASIDAGDGNDSVFVALKSSFPLDSSVSILGGNGDDTIFVFDPFPEVNIFGSDVSVDGGAGKDSIFVGGNNEAPGGPGVFIARNQGGAGNDTILPTGAFPPTGDGGEWNGQPNTRTDEV